MKCNTITECQGDKHLILDLDLRVEQLLRTIKVEREIVPCKEKTGELHLSVNLAYSENNQLKHINLPAYMKETEQERTLCVIFPPNLRISIWKDGADTAINRLEYHIDRRTEAVTEISGIAETEAGDSGFNHLNIDLGLMNNTDKLNTQALKEDILTQIRKITVPSLPLIIRLVLPNQPEYYCFPQGVKLTVLENVLNAYEIDLFINNPAISDYLNGDTVKLTIYNVLSTPAQSTVTFSGTSYVQKRSFVLYDNNDGYISNDSDLSLKENAHADFWDDLYNELKRGKSPVIYLKSKESKAYCPATYNFTERAEQPGIFNGFIEISYTQTDDNGNKYLCIENRNFRTTGFGGDGSMYDTDEVTGMVPIKKFPLGVANR